VALVRVLIGCVFVMVVTELKICHIYEVVLQTIKQPPIIYQRHRIS
jgi:hypothetical protein